MPFPLRKVITLRHLDCSKPTLPLSPSLSSFSKPPPNSPLTLKRLLWMTPYSHMRYILSEKYRREIVGLYRYNDLAFFENISGSQADLIRNNCIGILKDQFHLNTVCHSNPILNC